MSDHIRVCMAPIGAGKGLCSADFIDRRSHPGPSSSFPHWRVFPSSHYCPAWNVGAWDGGQVMGIDPVSKGYVVVTGRGRSGSNMLLDILNEHPRTLCRNEPDAMDSSPLRALPGGFFDEDLGAGFPEALHDALSAALLRDSERDHFGLKEKIWFRSPLRARIGQELCRNWRTRKLLGAFNPAYRASEWPRPAFYQDAGSLDRVLPVFKILRTPGWFIRSHEAHPGQKILHIIREPASFLRSWRNRYIERHTGGVEEVWRANCDEMPKVLDYFGARSSATEAFSTENLIETELWGWRYANEVMLARFGASDRYKILRFNDVHDRRRDLIEEIYEFCGLDLEERVWSRVSAQGNRLFKAADKRPFADVDIDSIVERVLDQSPLRPFV